MFYRRQKRDCPKNENGWTHVTRKQKRRKASPPKVPAAQPTIVKAVVAPPKVSGNKLMETQHQPTNKDMNKDKNDQRSKEKNVQIIKNKDEQISKPEFKCEWP